MNFLVKKRAVYLHDVKSESLGFHGSQNHLLKIVAVEFFCLKNHTNKLQVVVAAFRQHSYQL